ncbi:hypothetical protein BGZ65_000885, partial [Modicella reniformis]
VFYVIRGIAEATVHETEFVVTTGGRFLVPRGNQYGIVNLSDKNPCQLFFVQVRSADSNL